MNVIGSEGGGTINVSIIKGLFGYEQVGPGPVAQ